MARETKAHESAAVKELRDSNRDAMISEIRTMYRQANKQLRALEAADLRKASNAYRYIERRHFDKDSAISEDRSGRMQFDTHLARKSMQQLQHEKRELERFLYESRTSTVEGTLSAYERAYNTYIARNPGLNISRDKMGEIMQLEGMKNFVAAFGSSQISNLLALSENLDVSDIDHILSEMPEQPILGDVYAQLDELNNWSPFDM